MYYLKIFTDVCGGAWKVFSLEFSFVFLWLLLRLNGHRYLLTRFKAICSGRGLYRGRVLPMPLRDKTNDETHEYLIFRLHLWFRLPPPPRWALCVCQRSADRISVFRGADRCTDTKDTHCVHMILLNTLLMGQSSGVATMHRVAALSVSLFRRSLPARFSTGWSEDPGEASSGQPPGQAPGGRCALSSAAFASPPALV